MTTPIERTRAVNKVRNFLLDLVCTVKTKRVPKYIRDRARELLKHYPNGVDLLASNRKDRSLGVRK